MERLFEAFGNPKAVERAINDAIPNQDEILQLRKQQSRLEESLKQANACKQEIVKTVSKGLLTDDEIQEQMGKLRMQEESLRGALRKLAGKLENVPDKGYIKGASKEIVERLRSSVFPTRASQRRIPSLVKTASGRSGSKLWLEVDVLDSRIELMSWDDQRALVELVFNGQTPDGGRAGVYIRWDDADDERRWRYAIRGVVPLIAPESDESDAGVVVCASH